MSFATSIHRQILSPSDLPTLDLSSPHLISSPDQSLSAEMPARMTPHRRELDISSFAPIQGLISSTTKKPQNTMVKSLDGRKAASPSTLTTTTHPSYDKTGHGKRQRSNESSTSSPKPLFTTGVMNWSTRTAVAANDEAMSPLPLTSSSSSSSAWTTAIAEGWSSTRPAKFKRFPGSRGPIPIQPKNTLHTSPIPNPIHSRSINSPISHSKQRGYPTTATTGSTFHLVKGRPVRIQKQYGPSPRPQQRLVVYGKDEWDDGFGKRSCLVPREASSEKMELLANGEERSRGTEETGMGMATGAGLRKGNPAGGRGVISLDQEQAEGDDDDDEKGEEEEKEEEAEGDSADSGGLMFHQSAFAGLDQRLIFSAEEDHRKGQKTGAKRGYPARDFLSSSNFDRGQDQIHRSIQPNSGKSATMVQQSAVNADGGRMMTISGVDPQGSLCDLSKEVNFHQNENEAESDNRYEMEDSGYRGRERESEDLLQGGCEGDFSGHYFDDKEIEQGDFNGMFMDKDHQLTNTTTTETSRKTRAEEGVSLYTNKEMQDLTYRDLIVPVEKEEFSTTRTLTTATNKREQVTKGYHDHTRNDFDMSNLMATSKRTTTGSCTPRISPAPSSIISQHFPSSQSHFHPHKSRTARTQLPSLWIPRRPSLSFGVPTNGEKNSPLQRLPPTFAAVTAFGSNAYIAKDMNMLFPVGGPPGKLSVPLKRTLPTPEAVMGGEGIEGGISLGLNGSGDGYRTAGANLTGFRARPTSVGSSTMGSETNMEMEMDVEATVLNESGGLRTENTATGSRSFEARQVDPAGKDPSPDITPTQRRPIIPAGLNLTTINNHLNINSLSLTQRSPPAEAAFGSRWRPFACQNASLYTQGLAGVPVSAPPGDGRSQVGFPGVEVIPAEMSPMMMSGISYTSKKVASEVPLNSVQSSVPFAQHRSQATTYILVDSSSSIPPPRTAIPLQSNNILPLDLQLPRMLPKLESPPPQLQIAPLARAGIQKNEDLLRAARKLNELTVGGGNVGQRSKRRLGNQNPGKSSRTLDPFPFKRKLPVLEEEFAHVPVPKSASPEVQREPFLDRQVSSLLPLEEMSGMDLTGMRMEVDELERGEEEEEEEVKPASATKYRSLINRGGPGPLTWSGLRRDVVSMDLNGSGLLGGDGNRSESDSGSIWGGTTTETLQTWSGEEGGACVPGPARSAFKMNEKRRAQAIDVTGIGKAKEVGTVGGTKKGEMEPDYETRRHRCSECGLKFMRAHDLKRHFRLHTGEQPYACPNPSCGQRYERNDQLRRHITRTSECRQAAPSLSQYSFGADRPKKRKTLIMNSLLKRKEQEVAMEGYMPAGRGERS